MKIAAINASQIYFWLKDISDCENFLSMIRGFIKLRKKNVKHFFQFLMLNISSIKDLLHKPSEVQWNLKRKFFCTLSYKILPPEITKTWETAVFIVLWGPGNQCGIQWFFMILWIFESFPLYLLVRNNFNLN